MTQAEQAAEADYVDALDHIMRTARASRTKTRRLRWIEARARCVLEGGTDWRSINLPEGADPKLARLQARVSAFLARVQTLEQENARLRERLEEETAQHGVTEGMADHQTEQLQSLEQEARRIVEFFDACRRSPDALVTGGFRDAREWAEEFVRKVAGGGPYVEG
jgi:chromosome segregation ATPase